MGCGASSDLHPTPTGASNTNPHPPTTTPDGDTTQSQQHHQQEQYQGEDGDSPPSNDHQRQLHQQAEDLPVCQVEERPAKEAPKEEEDDHDASTTSSSSIPPPPPPPPQPPHEYSSRAAPRPPSTAAPVHDSPIHHGNHTGPTQSNPAHGGITDSQSHVSSDDDDDDGDYEMPEEQAPEEQGAAAPPMVTGLGDQSDEDGGGGICEDDDDNEGPVEQSAGSAGVQVGGVGAVVRADVGPARSGGGGGVGQSSHKIGMVYSPGSIPLGLRKQKNQQNGGSSAVNSPTHPSLPPSTANDNEDFLKDLEDELNQKPSPPKYEPRGKSGRTTATNPTSSNTTPPTNPLPMMGLGGDRKNTNDEDDYALYRFDTPSKQPSIFPSGAVVGGSCVATMSSSSNSRQQNPTTISSPTTANGNKPSKRSNNNKNRSPSVSSDSSDSVSSSPSSSESVDNNSSDDNSSDDGGGKSKKKGKKAAPKKVTGGARLALARLRAKQKSSEAKKGSKGKARP